MTAAFYHIMRCFRFVFVILCMGLMSLEAKAEWYNEITFVVGRNVSTPITVRYGGKNYTVYNTLTINTTGNTYAPSATDRDGNSLKYEIRSNTQTKGSNTYHYYTYTFSGRVTSGSTNSGGYNSGRSENSSSYGGGYNSGSTGARIGQGLAQLISISSFDEDGAYPGIHAAVGMSKGFGEFMRLRIVGGFQVYGGLGKDWFFNGDNKDKLLWHAGIGGYVSLGEDTSRWGDVGFGLTVAENAAWENLSLTFDMDFTYWIGRWRRVGVFAGGGIGWGDLKNVGEEEHHSSFAWNIECGLIFRIAKF